MEWFPNGKAFYDDRGRAFRLGINYIIYAMTH
jgi:hypothetical protein